MKNRDQTDGGVKQDQQAWEEYEMQRGSKHEEEEKWKRIEIG